jgi:hypothetical protein
VVDDDTRRIVWQSGDLGPGAERHLELNSQQFAFDNDSAAARVRITTDRMDSVTTSVEVRVERYDQDTGAAEYVVSVPER